MILYIFNMYIHTQITKYALIIVCVTDVLFCTVQLSGYGCNISTMEFTYELLCL